jgi:hypothetical protein
MRLEKHEIEKLYERELELNVWEWNYFKSLEVIKFRNLSLQQYLKALQLAKLKPSKWVKQMHKAEVEIWVAEKKRNKWKQ